jgi:hypothetical protein
MKEDACTLIILSAMLHRNIDWTSWFGNSLSGNSYITPIFFLSLPKILGRERVG